MMKIKIALIDDDILEFERFKKVIQNEETFDLFYFKNFVAFEDDQLSADIILLDLHLKEGSTLDRITMIRRAYPSTKIACYSSDSKSIMQALENGADDFILKGKDQDLLIRLQLLKKQCTQTSYQSAAVGHTMKFVDASIPAILSSAVRCVFVGGESGTGKELVVSLFEQHLKRSIIKVNCSALQDSLAESILFGHVRGAFTGALADKIGLFEAAEDSWIFLDEVGSLSPAVQAKILRVIESNEIIRVGDTKQISINLKFIFASHGDFKELVSKGTFRNDLWQRISEHQIQLPPLRGRKSEIDDLIEHFCQTEEGGPYVISREAKAILRELPWKEGNVRQLRNCIRAMTTKQVDRLLTPLSIPRTIWEQEEKDSSLSTVVVEIRDGEPFDDLELKFLVGCCSRLAPAKGSLTNVAASLGIPKSTLSRRLKDARTKGFLTSENFESWVGQKK